MTPYRSVLLAVSAAMALGGCASPPASPPPAAAGLDAKQRLVAALEKTNATGYRFSVSGDAVDGSGAYDPEAQRISVVQKTAGGARSQRIVVGTDMYSRATGGEPWVHLDLKRVGKDSPYHFDMTDPTGLARFTRSVDTVRSTGTDSYTGRLAIEGDEFTEGFLPVGTPAVSVWLGGGARFTATTEDTGWVTSISVEILDSSRTLRMVTRLSEHGRDQDIRRPPKYGEALDSYYAE